jgi:polar amino acid transport system substrate-binding protein
MGFLVRLLVVAAFAGALHAQALRIYTEIYEPLQIRSADGGLSGIAVDMVREIQRRVGNADPITVVPWARGYKEALSHPGVVLFAMSRTEDREGLFRWVGPLDETVFYFLVKAGAKVAPWTLEEARRLKAIGVYVNDVRDQYLTRAGFTNLDRADDNATNVKKLMLGRLDAVAVNLDEVKGLAERAGFKPSDLELTFPFLKTRQFIAFSRETDPETVARWQAALDGMRMDGTFKAIYRKYEPTKALPGKSKTR